MNDNYVWYFARTYEEAHEWKGEVDEVGVAELERRWREEDRARRDHERSLRRYSPRS
jgi:hypothetical protein